MPTMADRSSTSVVVTPDQRPNSWGFGDGQAIPWEYAPAPEARDIVTLQERYGLFINGRSVAATGGGTFVSIDPVDRAAPGRGRQGHRRGRRQGGAGRTSCPAPVVGPAVRPGACEVPLPDLADPPGARTRVRRARVDGLRQADQGEPGRRRPAGRQPLLVLRRLGRQARLRVPRPGRQAPRRGGPDHPVELPAADAGVEDRPGAGGRQHGRAQARVDHAALRDAVRRRRPAGRPATGHRQHRHRPGRDRDAPRDPPRRRQGGLHRLDRDRQEDRPRRRGLGQGPDARARRQGRQHRVRRRPARPGRRGHRQRHLLQPGRGVLRGVAAAGPGVDRRHARRQAQGPPLDDPRR